MGRSLFLLALLLSDGLAIGDTEREVRALRHQLNVEAVKVRALTQLVGEMTKAGGCVFWEAACQAPARPAEVDL